MRSGRRGQEGYVAVYVALVASLVLVPMVLLVIDLAALGYHRTKLRNTADAVALGAVAESQSIHIPIPTEWYGYIPVNGWMLNGIHLKNLETSFGVWRAWGESAVGEKLQQVAAQNQDVVGLKTQVVVGTAQVMPVGNLFSPYMYVEIPVSAEVQLQTPYLARLLSRGGEQAAGNKLTVAAKSCAVAWYRVDSWAHKWWTQDGNPLESLVHTLDQFLPLQEENEPHKYYRLVNCADDLIDPLSRVEEVIAMHLETQTGKRYTSPWDRVDEQNAAKGNPPQRSGTRKGEGSEVEKGKEIWDKAWNSTGKEFEPVRESMKRPDSCKAAGTCVDRDSTREWAKAEEEQERLAEEARKAAEKAAEEANAPGE